MSSYHPFLTCPRPSAGDKFVRMASRGSQPEESLILNVIGDKTVWNAWLVSGGHVDALDGSSRQFTDHDWRPVSWVKPEGAPYWCPPEYDWCPAGFFQREGSAPVVAPVPASIKAPVAAPISSQTATPASSQTVTPTTTPTVTPTTAPPLRPSPAPAPAV